MTTLAMEQDPAHLAVIDLLGSFTNVGLYEQGNVADTDSSAMTIGAPLPYLVYAISAPFSPSRRAGGWAGRDWEFSLAYVHSSSMGVSALIDAVRELIDGARMDVAGREMRIRQKHPGESLIVDSDKVWSRPGNGSLYFATEWWRIV